LYGQELDWGHFWKDVGISTVAGMVSGGVGRGISGNMTRAASGLLNTNNPGMNAAITAAIAGASGAGTNFAMQLGNMALFDENGNLNFSLNRVSLDNMDWNSVMNSGIIGAVQGTLTSYAQQRQNKSPELDDTPDRLLLAEPEELANSIPAQGKVVPQDQPDAVEGNGQPRVSDGVSVNAKNRLEEAIEVEFKLSSKHNTDELSQEFKRQLANQEEGMNKLTVDEFIKNRDEFSNQGRSAGGNAAQQKAREYAKTEKYNELVKSGIDIDEATAQANAWIKTQAALHDPDQIAGGDPTKIIGVGNARINSSIGAQWKTRIDDLDRQIRDIASNMTDAQKQNTYLNVRLTQ
jgi:hypothetical protein